MVLCSKPLLCSVEYCVWPLFISWSEHHPAATTEVSRHCQMFLRDVCVYHSQSLEFIFDNSPILSLRSLQWTALLHCKSTREPLCHLTLRLISFVTGSAYAAQGSSEPVILLPQCLKRWGQGCTATSGFHESFIVVGVEGTHSWGKKKKEFFFFF